MLMKLTPQRYKKKCTCANTMCIFFVLKSVFFAQILAYVHFLLYLCSEINKFVKNNFVKLYNYEVLRKKSRDCQIVAIR